MELALLILGIILGATVVWALNYKALRHLGWYGEPRYIPREIRNWVITASRSTCVYCGRQGDSHHDPDDQPWEIDHVVPLSGGGAHAVTNFALSCRKCNRSKRAGLPPMPVVRITRGGHYGHER